MYAKVRPVGSQVPEPSPVGDLSLPWETTYNTAFCGSGTESLSMAVRAAIATKNGPKKPEVIIPAYACPDLIAAIVAQDARPVLVDFTRNAPLLDLEGLQSAVTEQTVAVVAVNLLGLSERMSALSDLCRAHGLILIEDSAQRFPPISHSQAFADFVVLSFGRGKPINLMGGGALLTRKNRESTVQKLRASYPMETLRIDFLWRLKRRIFNILLSRFCYPWLERVPFLHLGETRFQPLDEIRFMDLPFSLLQAGMESAEGRAPLHKLLDRELAFLADAEWILLGCDQNESIPRLRYALLAPDANTRDQALVALNRSGIGASRLYRFVLTEIDGVPLDRLGPQRIFPNACDFASRLLTLPLHEGVSHRDVQIIVRELEHVSGQAQKSADRIQQISDFET